MTTATLSTEPSEKRHYFMTFNQDGSSLAVAGKYGYRLYPLERMNSTDEAYKSSRTDVCIVERLFTSSLVAIVSLNSPRKMKVCHFRKGTEICNYSYSNTILSIKLNRRCLVVCLDESLYIHMLSDMNIAHTIRDTPPNPTGLLALSPDIVNCYLAYPGSATVGEVQIFDAKNLTAKVIIHAHDSPLAALAFSQNGLQIATASEKGTVIRVFSSIDGRKLYEFRRGVKRCVSISGLAFSPCGQFLACSSNTETVHVFKLEEPRESPTEEANSTWMGYFSSYLPTQVTDVLTQGRAFSTAYLPESGVKNTLAFGRVDKEIKLYVATELGSLYVYNFNKSEGGEMQLEKRLDLNEGASAAATAPGGPATQVDGEPTEGGDWTEPVDAESDKLREMEIACASPPKDVLHLKDDQDFPPLSPNSESNND